jgi:hypothetical protein
MSQAELQLFRDLLIKAVKDLINTKPINPKKYLALALCKTIELSDYSEFPELQSSFRPAETPDTNSYPEGVQVKRRGSVVGESITQENLSQSPLFHEKSNATLYNLTGFMKTNALFAHIDDENLVLIAKALEKIRADPGDVVVRQNEDGDSCFFVEHGKLSCFVQERGLVGSYGPGDSFGEASIMYGNKRGATIQVRFKQAVEKSVLWKIDRITYKTLVVQALQPEIAEALKD